MACRNPFHTCGEQPTLLDARVLACTIKKQAVVLRGESSRVFNEGSGEGAKCGGEGRFEEGGFAVVERECGIRRGGLGVVMHGGGDEEKVVVKSDKKRWCGNGGAGQLTENDRATNGDGQWQDGSAGGVLVTTFG
ncbi:hypothetical protein Salat_2437900 [Sesamum alatum]|uniref:Uncharacterized protein n=1 Tax=Sesamum alatum TaxID=300844 RepID=A0AAE1XY58_9LAMI|nr:hypothetical protein Salat_2437900 [Sesamum alatum]